MALTLIAGSSPTCHCILNLMQFVTSISNYIHSLLLFESPVFSFNLIMHYRSLCNTASLYASLALPLAAAFDALSAALLPLILRAQQN